MKFAVRRFSRRFPEVECAILVVHEPPGPPVHFRQTHRGHPGLHRILCQIQGRYRGTAAAIVLPDGRFWCGVSLCSPSDPFIRATGRAKAIGRAYRSMRRPSECCGALGTMCCGALGTIAPTNWLVDYLHELIRERKENIRHRRTGSNHSNNQAAGEYTSGDAAATYIT